MKSFRWTLVFGVLIVGLVAFTFWDTKRSEKEAERKSESEKVVHFKPDEISRLELISRTGSIVLERKEAVWHLVQPIQDTADQQAVGGLLSAMENEKTTDVVAEGSGVQLATYGLDHPATGMKITAKDGRTQEIKIGSVKAFDGSLYLLGDQGNKVMLVSSVWDTHLTKPVAELRDKRLFRDTLKGDIQRIVLRSSRAPEATLVKEGDAWKVGKGGFNYPVSNEAVTTFIEQIKALRGSKILEESKSAKGALAKHGLDQPSWSVELEGAPAASGSEDRAKSGATATGPSRYTLALSSIKAKSNPSASRARQMIENQLTVAAMSSDADPILEVDNYAADSMRKGASDFYDKKRPFAFTAADVAQIEVNSADLKGSFVKKGEKWEFAQEPAAGGLQKEVDSGKLTDLVGKMSRLEAVRILAPLKKGETLKGESKIRLAKADGTQVFEFAWGQAVTEKAPGDGVEAKYLPARTSAVDHKIGVPEMSVTDLELKSLVKEKPAAAPAPQPSPSMTTEGAKEGPKS